MTEKRFVDIEIGADIGQIRLYTTDEYYETYDGEDILNLINDYIKENEQLKQQLVERERMIDVRDKIIADVMKAVNGDVE